MNAFNYFYSFVVGAVFGSFFNVLIYRLPQDISLIKPGSFCPKCKKPIRWYHNIPLVSFMLLGGRCSSCRAAISFQYPAVELISGLVFLYTYHRFHFSGQAIFYVLFFSVLIVISGIDFKHQVIPNVLSMPGILLGLIFQLLAGSILMAAVGAVFGGGLILLVRVFGGLAYRKEVMGMGDVYLTAMIGAFLGFPNILLAILVGAISGSVFGVIYLIGTRRHRESPIPFGPFLSFGGMVTALFHEPIIIFLMRLGINF